MAFPAPVKAAYWPSRATTSFPPSAIDTSLFTHIYYAFLVPSDATYTFEISTATAEVLSNFTNTLHQQNPPVKTLFAIGGADAGSSVFSRMASDANSRGVFIKSAIEVARKYGFDGMDLDWEFPDTQEGMDNLGKLFMEWRAAIKYEAESTRRAPLLLTAAVYFSVDILFNGVKYPAGSMDQNLDWVCAMCYDYHGPWDHPSKTGAPAALYDDSTTAVSVGPGNGVLTLAEVKAFNKDNGAKVVHDMETVSTYSYFQSTWIGYDDAITTTLKIGFAQA
ncbi:hypothetical protein COLO4_18755 [Corchorus olitorius]|uniref:GH18 domain-containing protein n=1 Tax=Corchorus olitorius TaxID=93759 RepID=A0A1R3J820_9ROSI|nr:hypothetical protein COLO4_18755 [Corchorus olitorius]